MLLLIAVSEQTAQLVRSIGSFPWELASVLRNPNPGMSILDSIVCL